MAVKVACVLRGGGPFSTLKRHLLFEETSTFFLARWRATLPFATRNFRRVSSHGKEETLYESRQPGIDDTTQRPLTQADGRAIIVSPSFHLLLVPLRVPQRSFHETNGHEVTLGVSRGIENGGRSRRINRNWPAEPKLCLFRSGIHH